MYTPLIFGVLVAAMVAAGFVGLWQASRSRDPVEARLREYGLGEGSQTAAGGDDYGMRKRPAWTGVNRLLAGFGFGPRLAVALARADVSLTAAEFALIIVGAAVVGFVIGAFRVAPLLGPGLGLAVGLAMGAVLGYLPLLYLRFRQSRRRRAITEQLPDVLTLLVGGLRAGYGLSQAMEMVVEELPPPISTEFGRVMRGVGLGLPVQTALNDMAARVDSDDLNLVVTAISVQHEMGGNLAQTLEIIGETVRDRIRMLREIRVLTAQQRLTGYLLAVLPLGLAILLFIINPDYMSAFLRPGLVRILPIVAVVLQVLGFLAIRHIVDIEV